MRHGRWASACLPFRGGVHPNWMARGDLEHGPWKRREKQSNAREPGRDPIDETCYRDDLPMAVVGPRFGKERLDVSEGGGRGPEHPDRKVQQARSRHLLDLPSLLV